MPKKISSKKKCQSLGRVWVKRSRRAKAYCRKKPARPVPRAADVPVPRAADIPVPRAADIPVPRLEGPGYHYGFLSELKFVQDGRVLECEQVNQVIKTVMDDYFRDSLPMIAERFNVRLYHLYRIIARGFTEPDLTLESIRRENCSIYVRFHSNEKISRGAHQLIRDAIDDIQFLFPREGIQLLFDRLHYDIDEFTFTSHLPDYTNEANLSDPHYRYAFKTHVLIDQHACNDAVVRELKQNLVNYTIEDRDRLIERLNAALRQQGKNMNVVTLRFEPETCHFKFEIQNQGPLSALDYQFISRGHEWEILTEEECNDVSGDAFTLRLNDPFRAEYDY
jgi:hypothetical protein